MRANLWDYWNGCFRGNGIIPNSTTTRMAMPAPLRVRYNLNTVLKVLFMQIGPEAIDHAMDAFEEHFRGHLYAHETAAFETLAIAGSYCKPHTLPRRLVLAFASDRFLVDAMGARRLTDIIQFTSTCAAQLGEIATMPLQYQPAGSRKFLAELFMHRRDHSDAFVVLFLPHRVINCPNAHEVLKEVRSVCRTYLKNMFRELYQMPGRVLGSGCGRRMMDAARARTKFFQTVASDAALLLPGCVPSRPRMQLESGDADWLSVAMNRSHKATHGRIRR